MHPGGVRIPGRPRPDRGENAVVLGVSPDPPERHAKFIGKHGLTFRLLSDPDPAVAQTYGAWGEKVMYGKRAQGIPRSTVVIDEAGSVARIYRKVKPEGHAEEILEAL